MKFSRRREMSLVKPEMSLVKFQNVPGKYLEGVATLPIEHGACRIQNTIRLNSCVCEYVYVHDCSV